MAKQRFKYFLFNKPYNVLSQFTRETAEHKVIGDYYTFPSTVYPVGRLDKDSEGLLLLTDDKKLVDKLLNPSEQKTKTYLAQVDGDITLEAIRKLQLGVIIKLPNKKTYKTLPANISRYEPTNIEERDPPVRFRKDIPTSWIRLEIKEGKNRQIRKMCASVDFPVLRLIRTSFGKYKLGDLPSGKVKEIFKP